MNPASIFKSSLLPSTNTFGSVSQTTPQVAAPKAAYVASLAPSTSVFNGGTATPTSSFTSAPSTTIPSGPQSTLPNTVTSGGNSAATTPITPKQAYVNSQVSTSANSAPAGTPVSSTAPVVNQNNVNPNAAYQGISTPGNVDQTSPQYQYQQAFQTYLNSLQPSTALNNATTALNAQTLQAQEDNETALDKPGQTLGFATGEAARVAKNNAFQTDALTNTVNSLTSAQNAQETGAEAGLNFEKSLYDEYNTANAPKADISVSPGATVFDPNTGQPLYTAATADQLNGTNTQAGNNSQLAPYLQTSGNGQQYVDLSSVTGAEKNTLAQAAAANGVKVITSANASADLTNIQNAYLNLDTIAQSFQGLTSPNAVERNLAGVGLGAVSSFFQTNAQDTAATALNDSALDLLKSISGVQGFRGNQGAIDQIRDNLPTIYDTSDVATQKLANVKALIENRESALLGTTSTTGASTDTSAGGADYQSYLSAIGAQ